jgi:hypothetical protein
MTDASYIAAGYGIVFGTLALYALRLLRRGRALARKVPREDLPWT